MPHHAMFGGTLVGPGGGQIVMDPHAVLGSVNPQLGEYPAASTVKVAEQRDKNEIGDRTLILADVARKAIVQVRQRVKALLLERMGERQAEGLADARTPGEWTHDRPILAREAREYSLDISTEIPKEIHSSCASSLNPRHGARAWSTSSCPTRNGRATGALTAGVPLLSG